MDAVIFMSFFLFVILSIMLAFTIFFSPNEFKARRSWIVRSKDGGIDWRRVDAGKFALNYLYIIWAWLLAVCIFSALLGRYL